MKDLVDQYHPDFFYTDGGIPFGDVGRSLVAHLYNSNQASHGGRLEAVYTCKNMETGGEFAGGTCVEDVERGMLPAISPLPWQTDTSNGDWYSAATTNTRRLRRSFTSLSTSSARMATCS